MNWILEHLQIVFVAILVIGSLLKTMWEAKANREAEREVPWEPREPVPLDEDKSYRKHVPGTPPPLPSDQQQPPPRPRPESRVARAPVKRKDPAVAAAEAVAREEAARMLKHQQNLAAHLQQLRETKASVSGGAAATRARVEARNARSKPFPESTSLKTRMKSRAELRRAIIMREILDPPVGLR